MRIVTAMPAFNTNRDCDGPEFRLREPVGKIADLELALRRYVCRRRGPRHFSSA